MELKELTDIFLAIFTGTFSLIVVFGRNPIISALSLLIAFVGFGGIYFQLGSVFITTIQILVYAGAIAILFIFVLMLINTSDYKHFQTKKSLSPILGTICIAILFGGFTLVLNNNMNYLSEDKLPVTPMNTLFDSLLNKYMLPFELATVLLLGAIVASVILANKGSKNG